MSDMGIRRLDLQLGLVNKCGATLYNGAATTSVAGAASVGREHIQTKKLDRALVERHNADKIVERRKPRDHFRQPMR